MPPVFSTADRQYDVVFPFAWRDTDGISITLPAGYHLEKPENPGNIDLGETGSYELAMTMRGRTLICLRNLVFGKSGHIRFARQSYSTLKALFDEIHRHDEVTFALREDEPQAGGAK